MLNEKEIIARRAALQLRDGDVVNLGIGLPSMIPDYLPIGIKVIIQSENGLLNIGASPEPGEENPRLLNASGKPTTILPGGCCFDSSISFGIIRGGHVQATVLGALEVDEEGNLANWAIPGKLFIGMGGAMDLVVGAKEVIVAMLHTQQGKPKIVKRCSLPLTAKKQVNKIITEMAFIEVTGDGLILKEIAPNVTVDDVVNATDARLIISKNIGRFFS